MTLLILAVATVLLLQVSASRAAPRRCWLGVVKGDMEVVEGMKYRLVVKVKDGATMKSFEAVVWDKAWEYFRGVSYRLRPFRPMCEVVVSSSWLIINNHP
ncbi:hypothetical protein NL676_007601 [Syzygium grande]|nr:hypothetical protein NL676_007601 [Syzygium grande]